MQMSLFYRIVEDNQVAVLTNVFLCATGNLLGWSIFNINHTAATCIDSILRWSMLLLRLDSEFIHLRALYMKDNSLFAFC